MTRPEPPPPEPTLRQPVDARDATLALQPTARPRSRRRRRPTPREGWPRSRSRQHRPGQSRERPRCPSCSLQTHAPASGNCPAWKNLHLTGSHGWSPTSSFGIVTRPSQRSRKADSERSDQIHDSPRGAARHLCTLTLAEVPGKGERPEQSWLDHRAGGSSTRRLCNSAVRVWIAPVSSVLDLSSNSTSLKP
jgi:hypothetical protein